MSSYKSNKFNQEINNNVDDPQFRIQPYQQIFSSCGGALITSLFSKFFFLWNFIISNKCFMIFFSSSFLNSDTTGCC